MRVTLEDIKENEILCPIREGYVLCFGNRCMLWVWIIQSELEYRSKLSRYGYCGLAAQYI